MLSCVAPGEAVPPAPEPKATFARLRSAWQVQPHGTRLRYLSGCRCAPCRASNAAYERARIRARQNGDWNGYVDASRARNHLLWLSRRGVGRRAVRAASDVGATTLAEVITGRKTQIRARTERKILSIDLGARADGALVPAGPTWQRIKCLLAEGYTKAQLALWLGCKTPALQVQPDRITARTAMRVERMCNLIEAGVLRRPAAAKMPLEKETPTFRFLSGKKT